MLMWRLLDLEFKLAKEIPDSHRRFLIWLVQHIFNRHSNLEVKRKSKLGQVSQQNKINHFFALDLEVGHNFLILLQTYIFNHAFLVFRLLRLTMQPREG